MKPYLANPKEEESIQLVIQSMSLFQSITYHLKSDSQPHLPSIKLKRTGLFLGFRYLEYIKM